MDFRVEPENNLSWYIKDTGFVVRLNEFES
jgi:hypothetical protein